MSYLRRLLNWGQDKGRNLFHREELAVASTLRLRDRVKVAEGILSLYEYPCDDKGAPIREKGRCRLVEKNLIVNTGRASLAALNRGTFDGGVAFGVYDFGYLAVGDGSGGGGTTPQPTDTALANELTGPAPLAPPAVILRPLLTCTTPPPGPPYLTNLWSAQIGPAELNGYTLDEAALICLDNITMGTYRTFPGQAKAAGVAFEFRWVLVF